MCRGCNDPEHVCSWCESPFTAYSYSDSHGYGMVLCSLACQAQMNEWIYEKELQDMILDMIEDKKED